MLLITSSVINNGKLGSLGQQHKRKLLIMLLMVVRAKLAGSIAVINFPFPRHFVDQPISLVCLCLFVCVSANAGYDPALAVEAVEKKFLCPHCDRILRMPVQTGCGERFCRPCADGILK